MHLVILSCKKATLLIEKRHTKPLSLIESIQLGMHLQICEKCSRYQKQSLIIETLLKQKSRSLENPSEIKLSDKSKDLIQKIIEEKLKNK